MKYSANSVWENKDEYDVAVIGGGHAGCEAALACARLGFKTVMFTASVDSIALMPCNPNIGGSSKGHLVRELDALGGEMGKVIDQTFIQSKMLNQSKGPAVHSLRAQADKAEYGRAMRKVLEEQENLDIRQMEVTEILTEEVEKIEKSAVLKNLRVEKMYLKQEKRFAGLQGFRPIPVQFIVVNAWFCVQELISAPDVFTEKSAPILVRTDCSRQTI